MNIATVPPPGDFTFTDADFQKIAGIANARYGLFLQPSKKALVYSRLSKRLRALTLPSFDAYCDVLSRDENKDEEAHFLSALTTNVTHFFREMHHFTFLKDVLAPQLLKKAQTGGAVRLWSSACSAGQEAYCMAASLLAGAPEIARFDVKVLATDIDPQIVSKARMATYPEDQREAIPDEWRALMIAPKSDGKGFAINDDVRRLISFAELNLIAEWPMRRPFDVIFCRNAAIYFDKTTQARLWQRFSDALDVDGHLMIGHSERLNGPAQSEFRSVGITTYAKQPRADAESPAKRETEK